MHGLDDAIMERWATLSVIPDRTRRIKLVMNLQEAFTEALLVDLAPPREARVTGRILEVNRLLKDAYASGSYSLSGSARRWVMCAPSSCTRRTRLSCSRACGAAAVASRARAALGYSPETGLADLVAMVRGKTVRTA